MKCNPMEKPWRTVFGLVAGLGVVSTLGFHKTYFGLFPGFAGTPWVVHAHVASVLAWLVMLAAQAWLASRGHFDLHRRVGRLSYLLVPVIVAGFGLITHQGQMRHKSPDLLGAVLFDGGLFLLFYALALWHRKHASYHASYMTLSAVPFINPGLGRAIAPEVSIPVEFLLLLSLFLWAYFRKKPYRPYLVALVSFMALLGLVVYASIINPAVVEWVWVVIWG